MQTHHQEAKNVIYAGFFSIIPTLVKCLYHETDPTEPVPRLKENISELVYRIPSIENLKLEYFMEEEEDRLKYRQLLHRVNLKWNGVENKRELLSHLVSTKVCPLIENDDEEPDSLQYTPLNTIRLEKPQGPLLWGPYFWKIFHFIGKLQYYDEDIIYMQNIIPSLLHVLIPCPECEKNYNTHIKPSTLPNAIINPERLYIEIHDRVTTQCLKPPHRRLSPLSSAN